MRCGDCKRNYDGGCPYFWERYKIHDKCECFEEIDNENSSDK